MRQLVVDMMDDDKNQNLSDESVILSEEVFGNSPTKKKESTQKEMESPYKSNETIEKLSDVFKSSPSLNSSISSELSSEDHLMSTIDELLALNEKFDSIIKWMDFNRNRKEINANSSKLLKEAYLQTIEDEIRKENQKKKTTK